MQLKGLGKCATYFWVPPLARPPSGVDKGESMRESRAGIQSEVESDLSVSRAERPRSRRVVRITSVDQQALMNRLAVRE